VAQRAIVMLLEPIYEQDVRDCSFDFRAGRNAHQALWVLSTDHAKQRELLVRRVTVGW
jgi:RNA-directed DNA polymerase